MSNTLLSCLLLLLFICSVVSFSLWLHGLKAHWAPLSMEFPRQEIPILEWTAISFSRGSSWPRDWTHISCIGRQILYHWATWKPFLPVTTEESSRPQYETDPSSCALSSVPSCLLRSISPTILLLLLLSQPPPQNVGGSKTQFLACFPWCLSLASPGLKASNTTFMSVDSQFISPAWTSLFHSRQVSPLPTWHSHQDAVPDGKDYIMLC